ncbi:uncharacterized protein [Centruroides vittatus]|uniref:uncharacterized protein n=1 Tax=Centruroides vittatus TaxID=120091 RepID=UPI0035100B1C
MKSFTSLHQKQRFFIPLTLIAVNAAITSLTPYLGPQMRDKGFTFKETANIITASSFISILGPLIIGPVADRRANYKLLIIVMIFMSTIFYTSLLFVPRVIRVPREPLKQFDCTSSIYLEKCSNWENCVDAKLGNDDLVMFRLSKCRYMCSNSRVADVPYPLHICFESNEGNLCSVYNPLLKGNVSLNFKTYFTEWKTEELKNMKTTDFLEYDEDLPPQRMKVCQFHPSPPIFVSDRTYNNIYCRPVPKNCYMRCQLSFIQDEKEIFPIPCTDTLGNIQLTFWAYLGMRTFGDLCITTAVFLLDALILTGTNDFYGAYGRTHLWSAVGLASVSPLAGVLIDYFSTDTSTTNYLPAVCIYDLIVLFTCCVLFFLPLKISHKDGFGRYNWLTRSNAAKALHQHGTWTSEESEYHRVCIAVLCHSAHSGVSFVHNPWWVLPFEAMETFTMSVMWIGVVAFGQNIVSFKSRLPMQYSLNIVHFCVGRGVGSFLGGILLTKFTRKQTFLGYSYFFYNIRSDVFIPSPYVVQERITDQSYQPLRIF